MGDVRITDARIQLGVWRAFSPRGSIYIDFDGPPKTVILTVHEGGNIIRKHVKDWDLKPILNLLPGFKDTTTHSAKEDGA